MIDVFNIYQIINIYYPLFKVSVMTYNEQF
jgi:hypothetical protein